MIEFRLFDRIVAYANRHEITQEAFLFRSLSRNGLMGSGHLSTTAYWSIIRKYAKRCGFEHIGTHSLRASFVTLLHEKGLNVQEIKDAVGHKSIQMTSHYIKSHYDSKKKGARVMGGMLEF